MPSHRTRTEDAAPRYDGEYSDEEDFANSALPAARARSSRRDYDGESDSVDNTDDEDRKLEAELWDEEEVVGAPSGRKENRKWSMNALGKSGGSQQYASVGSRGHSRSNSARSTNSSSSRRSRQMNSIALPGLGAFGNPGNISTSWEKRPLSLSGSPPPPPKAPSRKSRYALYSCGAIAVAALVATVIAVVMMKNRETTEAPSLAGNSTTNSTSLPSSLSAGAYPSSLNSVGMYPGHASEFDNGQYHSSGSAAATTAPINSAQSTGRLSATPLSSPTGGLEHPVASSGALASAPSKSSASASSTSTDDDPWYYFGFGEDASTTSAKSDSKPSASTSMDWATFGGHGLSPASSSPSPSPTSALQHGGAQQMTVMTWGTEVITVNAGGANAPNSSPTSTTSSVNWNAPATTTTAPQAWGAPVVAPTPAAASPSSFATANFSMAIQPESFQTRDGTATVFSADGHLSACGIAGNSTDYLVALPLALYQSTLVQESKVESTYCGAQVLVTSLADGATVTAWVSGACTHCEGQNSLDLSEAVYSALKGDSKTDDDMQIIWGFVNEAVDKAAPFASAGAATTVLTSWSGKPKETSSASPSSSSDSGWW